MKVSLQYWTYCIFGLMILMSSCKKEKDPPPTEGDARLTNHYCNDPNAVNYNRGFPGIADSSICIYPVDSFLGKWQFLDSTFNSDSSFLSFQTKILEFSSSEDTTKQHLAIHGWCNQEILFAVANKFQKAIVDTLLNTETFKGQVLCSQLDSISGYFNLNTYKKDSMIIHLEIRNLNGSQFHKGWAIKQ